MKKEKLIVLAALFSMALGTTHLFAEQVTSLRGITPLDEIDNNPNINKVQDDREPIERDYVQQPPLVPHKIKGYKINAKFNKCLTCHSWANYKQAGATKISQTHFNDRENNVLANIAARRYFCTQCHVPQVNANPLVENTFKPITTIKH